MTTRRPTPTARATRVSRIAPPLRGASFTIGVIAFLVYLAMTPAASGDKDGSEFTVVLATLGAAHPTGYALYTIVGHGFVRLAHALGGNLGPPRSARRDRALAPHGPVRILRRGRVHDDRSR